MVVAVAETASDDTRARSQRGAAAAVLHDLPRWGGASRGRRQLSLSTTCTLSVHRCGPVDSFS